MEPRKSEDWIGLIVNADDFGLSRGVNEGIIAAHQHGIVTSTSLMVRRPAASDAVARANSHPALSVGLHFDLGEWVCRDGTWSATMLNADPDDEAAVRAEFEAQLGIFEDVVGRCPTHLDSHQHVHRSEPAKSVLTQAAGALGIPLRQVTPGVRHVGDFYGQAGPGMRIPAQIGVPALLTILVSLQPGVTEIGCHPGLGPDIPSDYGSERERETMTLSDERVRRRVTGLGIELISFGDLQAGVTVQ